MENASRALLIAGGVLIAIIVITLLIHTYGDISSFQRQQVSNEEVERIENFNKEYTKYQNQYVYGTEVITVINKVYSSEYPVTIEIKFIEGGYKYKKYVYKDGKKTEKQYTVNSGETMILKTDDSEKFDAVDWRENYNTNLGTITENADGSATVNGLKNRYFQCSDIDSRPAIDYDKKTGRVTAIRFIEKARK